MYIIICEGHKESWLTSHFTAPGMTCVTFEGLIKQPTVCSTQEALVYVPMLPYQVMPSSPSSSLLTTPGNYYSAISSLEVLKQ